MILGRRNAGAIVPQPPQEPSWEQFNNEDSQNGTNVQPAPPISGGESSAGIDSGTTSGDGGDGYGAGGSGGTTGSGSEGPYVAPTGAPGDDNSSTPPPVAPASPPVASPPPVTGLRGGEHSGPPVPDNIDPGFAADLPTMETDPGFVLGIGPDPDGGFSSIGQPSRSPAQPEQFTDGNGTTWTRDPNGALPGETAWTATVNGKKVTIAIRRSRDGNIIVRQGGTDYYYDSEGDLVADHVRDPGQALERPLGPDVATVVLGIWPALPPTIKAAILNELQDYGEAQTPKVPKPGRNLQGQYVPGHGPANNGKLAEKKELDRIQRTRPDLIRDQKRATHPDLPASGRFYDGLLPNGDGTYTGIEIKSGDGTKDAKQGRFDDLVSAHNPATVTLPDGRTVEITRVRDLQVPAELDGG